MGHFAGLQRHIFPHANCPKVKEISQVLPVQSDFSVHRSSLWFGHSSTGVHQGGQRGETHGSSEGYQDPPVPRRLVTESPFPGNLPTTYPDPLGPLPAVGVGSKYDQIRASSQTDLQFSRLLVRPDHWLSSPHSRPVGNASREIEVHKRSTQLYGQTVHVLDTPAYSYRETSEFQSPSYEAHSVTSKEKLARSGGIRKGYSSPSVTPQSSRLVARRDQCAERPTFTPSSARRSTLYRRLKRRLGAHLEDSTARGVWSPMEGLLHINYLEMKAVLLALKQLKHQCRDQIVLVATDNTTVVSYINKQGGMKSGSLCALLWRLLSWCHPSRITLRVRHIPGCLNVIADKLSRHNQVIQTEWSRSQQVFSHLYSIWVRPRVDLFATWFNHKLPRFVSPVPDPTAWAVDALSLQWDQLEAYAFPPVSLIPQVISKLRDQCCRSMILIAPGWPNMPWFWDLVDLSVQIPFRLPQIADLVTQPFNKLQKQESHQLQSSCLAPRIIAIQEHGFSHEVAAQMEAPQRSSTRAVYKSKWFHSHEVDFRAPSENQIADFLLYLFKERNLQPSTIEGYRTAIADMVSNHNLNISMDENFTRLLDSFQRDKPKGRRGVPSWNLSLVLHQLTKAPFEPLRKASLKHLSFKTVFLLALGSGKRWSEIHAWL